MSRNVETFRTEFCPTSPITQGQGLELPLSIPLGSQQSLPSEQNLKAFLAVLLTIQQLYASHQSKPEPFSAPPLIVDHVFYHLDSSEKTLLEHTAIALADIERIRETCEKWREESEGFPLAVRYYAQRRCREVLSLIEKRCNFERMVEELSKLDVRVSSEAASKANGLLDIIRMQAPSRAIYEEAVAAQQLNTYSPNIRIEFVQNLPFDGLTHHDGLIQLRASSSTKSQLATLLFELTNVRSRAAHRQIHDWFTTAIADPTTPPPRYYEPTERHERIEYLGVHTMTAAVQRCIREGWDPSTDLYGNALKREWDSFSNYLASQQSKHAEHYNRFYRGLERNSRFVVRLYTS